MTGEFEGDVGTKSGKRIAYIIGDYPNLTTTFIDRELIEAKRLGLNITIVAIRKPDIDVTDQAVESIVAGTLYIRPVSVIRMLRAHLRFLVTRPRRYVGTLTYLVTRPHPSVRSWLKTILHWVGGVMAADLLLLDGADHVHAHFADRATVLAIVVSRLLNIPYSVTAHAYDIYRSPAFLQDKITEAEFAVTCTAYNKQHLERVTGQEVELIYHGLDFEGVATSDSHSRSAGAPLILSVGRLQEKKGFPCLIRACALLRDHGIPFRCEIVGDGSDREQLTEHVRELQLEEFVSLCGALPHSEVLSKYAHASAFVLACKVADDGDRDGIPNVILEAMAHGLPVISTEISGIPEVLRHRDTGILVKPDCPANLYEGIAYVLANPEQASEIGDNARTFVRNEFDVRQNVGRLIELLVEQRT